MKPFFDTPEKQQAVVAEARSWLGTPFFPFARVKGHGVDCVNLAAGIYLALGVIQEFWPPPYLMDEGIHSSTSKVLDYLRDNGRFVPVDKPEIAGDLLCLRIERIVYHVGVFIGGTSFMHVFKGESVMVSDVRDSTWSSRFDRVFRPIV